MNRTIVIFLDAFDFSLAQRYLARGDMPALARLSGESSQWWLDHGSARRSGLAAEHYAAGVTPAAYGRYSAVHFDPVTYEVWSESTTVDPFTTQLDLDNVVFDLPYFDLERSPGTVGMTNWGAHDPGTQRVAQPAALEQEIISRFGHYPAGDWIYAYTWPSPEDCITMGNDLAHALEKRTDIACWLLEERFPNWSLAQVAVSEAHSAIEALYHGIDVDHPLAAVSSAPAAGESMRRVYQGIDKLIDRLSTRFSDANLVVVSMHGMGPNKSDVPSMSLLPELLYRFETGQQRFDPQPCGVDSADSDVRLPVVRNNWQQSMRAGLVPLADAGSVRRKLRRWHRRRALKRARGHACLVHDLDWIPASAYRAQWPLMRAFALPAFYDGRVRVNLAGRERRGIVPRGQYDALLDEICALLNALTVSGTGQPAVGQIERYEGDPMQLSASDADLVIVWSDVITSLAHPTLGEIGPLPMRRTGGHTGGDGMLLIRAAPGERLPVGAGDDMAGLTPGTRAARVSAFDVAPTVCHLLGRQWPDWLSGSSLLQHTDSESAITGRPLHGSASL